MKLFQVNERSIKFDLIFLNEEKVLSFYLINNSLAPIPFRLRCTKLGAPTLVEPSVSLTPDNGIIEVKESLKIDIKVRPLELGFKKIRIVYNDQLFEKVNDNNKILLEVTYTGIRPDLKVSKKLFLSQHFVKVKIF